MIPHGQPELGPFGFQVLPRCRVGPAYTPEQQLKVVWTGTGPLDVPISALHSGIIIFEFDQATAYRGGAVPAYSLPENRIVPRHVGEAEKARKLLAYRRLEYMNAYMLALYSAVSTVQRRAMWAQPPVDPSNYIGAVREGSNWRLFTEHQLSYPDEHSWAIDGTVLEEAISIVSKVSRIGTGDSLALMSLINAACYHYGRHQFDAAHLIAWSAIEAMLNIIWAQLLSEIDLSSGGHTEINSKRRKLLTGKDYTASIISQMLSLSGKLNDNLLERADEARKTRNDFAHQLERIGSHEAGNCIRLATDLLSRLSDARVTSPLVLSFRL